MVCTRSALYGIDQVLRARCKVELNDVRCRGALAF
jgi:hypothetical protein